MLREKSLRKTLEHVDWLEERLDEHAPGEATVTERLTDDGFQRSYNSPP